jgi:hypothetical protein
MRTRIGDALHRAQFVEPNQLHYRAPLIQERMMS